MDRIQRYLVKMGKEDFAQEYYEKYSAAKKKKNDVSYIRILSMARNLKTDAQFADFKEKLKKELKSSFAGFTADQKKIINREIEKKETLYKKKKDKK